jgi:hypothetical protein
MLNTDFANIPFNQLPDSWPIEIKLAFIENGAATVIAGTDAETAKGNAQQAIEGTQTLGEQVGSLSVDVESNALNIEQQSQVLNDHTNASQAHGASGNIVGTNNFASESLGGVVLLAVEVAKLSEFTPEQAGSEYNQAEENAHRQAVAAAINGIINKVNEIINGQQTARQMQSNQPMG